MRTLLFLSCLFSLMGCAELGTSNATMTHNVVTRDTRGRTASRTETTTYSGKHFNVATGPFMPGYMPGVPMGYGHNPYDTAGRAALAQDCRDYPDSHPGQCNEREIGIVYTTETAPPPPPAVRTTNNANGQLPYDISELQDRQVDTEKRLDLLAKKTKYLSRNDCRRDVRDYLGSSEKPAPADLERAKACAEYLKKQDKNTTTPNASTPSK